MIDREQIETRLRELRRESERGYGRLALLEQERERIRERLMNIGGAIQVLEELKQLGQGAVDTPFRDRPDSRPASG